MDYNNLLDWIFFGLYCKMGFDSAGTISENFKNELETELGEKRYLELEDNIRTVMDENAFMGFLMGFNVAHVLATGKGEIVPPEPDAYEKVIRL